MCLSVTPPSLSTPTQQRTRRSRTRKRSRNKSPIRLKIRTKEALKDDIGVQILCQIW